MVTPFRFINIAQLLVIAAAIATLAGCSSDGKSLDVPDRRPDYQTSKSGNALSVPPDLTSSTIDDSLIVPELNPRASANLSDYQAERGDNERVVQESVLAQRDALRIRRDGQRRWLYVEQNAPLLWDRVKSFWTDNGFELPRADPRIGIMETNWLENRADIPDGPIRSALKRFLDSVYSAPTRDRFRVRIEPSVDGNGSDVYLTHYGVEEVSTGREGEILLWQPRERDPELEAEMLSRLMVHLGAEEQRAATIAKTDQAEASSAPRSRYVDTADGYRALVIEEPYDRAWRLVGLALDGSDFVIEDQNRAEGLYLVGRSLLTRNPKDKDEGFFGGLFSSSSDELPSADQDAPRHRVRLAGRGERTLVVVQNDQEQPDASETAEQLLETVQSVIR